MPHPRTQRIADFLVRAGVIDELQLRSALAQHENWGGRLAHVVAQMGLAPEEKIVDTLARALGVQRIRLGNIQKDVNALARLDVSFAESRGVFPVQLRDQGKVLLLAMADPSDLDAIDEVSRRARARVQAYIAGESEIRAAIDRHYRGLEPDAAPRPTRDSMRATEAEGDDEAFKIVDASGRTVVRNLADVAPSVAAPPVDDPLPGAAAPGVSAADLLDDILGEGGPKTLTPEELQRLSTVQVNQEKSGKILRAVMELLVEKGYLTPQELQSRTR